MSTMATEAPETLLIDAAMLLELLALVGDRHMLEMHDEVERLLGQITPAMCRRMAQLLKQRDEIERPGWLVRFVSDLKHDYGGTAA